MRTITTHHTNEANRQIEVTADDRTHGNASYTYHLRVTQSNGSYHVQQIGFQLGPIQLVGVNGVTNEALLAILIDRMDGFQSGPYACEENALALTHLRAAFDALESRTRNREARGVEGTHQL